MTLELLRWQQVLRLYALSCWLPKYYIKITNWWDSIKNWIKKKNASSFSLSYFFSPQLHYVDISNIAFYSTMPVYHYYILLLHLCTATSY